jgi:dolichol-phosphate mannosyltransferase
VAPARVAAIAPAAVVPTSPELAVVVPTLNERDNLAPLVAGLEAALHGIAWEVIVVDDDSKDGTWPLLLELQRRQPRIRALRRIGRRGLAAACIEGMLATSAPYLAVMDADLQHDAAALPAMLATLKAQRLDVVVGTRFAGPGGAGGLSRRRLAISRLGRLISRAISRAELSDPMSGFFVIDRALLEVALPRLSGRGFKLLLDLLASAPRPVRLAEMPYRFRPRRHGQSKLDAPVLLDHAILIGDKLLGRHLPVRFVLFAMVGLLGVAVHLAALGLGFRILGLSFGVAQTCATLVAMTSNFTLNNVFTHRDRRLRGLALVYGHLSFYLVCAIGALANVQLARMLYAEGAPWALAGLLGAAVGAVWNYGVSATVTWRARP